MSQWRYMRGNQSLAAPANLAFVDTETFPTPDRFHPATQYHSFRLGVARFLRLERGKITRRHTLRFTKVDDFWVYAAGRSEPRRPLWIFAHNLPFDLTVLDFWNRLAEKTFILNQPSVAQRRNGAKKPTTRRESALLVTDDPPTVISCWDARGGKYIFVDTLNYWRQSLARLGASLDCPKLPMPGFGDPDEVWMHYCENDALILENAVLKLIAYVRDHDLGMFRMTAPSQAMAAFRHRFMQSHTIVLHDNADVKALERAAYYGGRTQCFYLGDTANALTPKKRGRYSGCGCNGDDTRRVYQLDVASLYPSVMQGHGYPVRLLGHYECNPDNPLPPERLGLDCIARVKLKTDVGHYPYRNAIGTIYPVGEYWTTLAGPELVRAIDDGAVAYVHSWAWYELRDIFYGYVHWFWNERRIAEQTGDTIHAQLCKLMLNSLYGKFGQKLSSWTDCPDKIAPAPFAQWTEASATNQTAIDYRAIGWHVQSKGAPEEHPGAFPAIAAYVTSYGRCRMRDLYELARPSNVYYMATDSLYTTHEGHQRMVAAGEVTPRTLGKLTLEAVHDSFVIHNLNRYDAGDKHVRGCIKPSARQLDEWTYAQPQFQGLAGILRVCPTNIVTVTDVEKTLSSTYRRGTRTSSGWVAPLVIKE